jgi:NADPH:quinone reductase
MRAAFYTRFGTPRNVLEIGELPAPEPVPGEVRVRLAVSGVNPVDWKIMAGQRSPFMPFPRIIPHSDGAGVVDAVGAGVLPSRLGERVWVMNGQVRRAFGTAAEYITVPSEQATTLPDGVPIEVGACLGIPAMTAHRVLTIDGPIRGQTLLITGGAGAVGNYAIQIAKLKGAHVIATVSSPDKARHALAAGADHVVDYRASAVGERVLELTGGEGVDRIVETDLAGNLTELLPSLKQGGIVAVYGSATDMSPCIPVASFLLKDVRLHFVSVFVVPAAEQREAIADVTTMMELGELQHTIAARFPLDRVVDAHEMVIAGRQIGKVLVELP